LDNIFALKGKMLLVACWVMGLWLAADFEADVADG
jgi:hypothetical protein